MMFGEHHRECAGGTDGERVQRLDHEELQDEDITRGEGQPGPYVPGSDCAVPERSRWSGINGLTTLQIRPAACPLAIIRYMAWISARWARRPPSGRAGCRADLWRVDELGLIACVSARLVDLDGCLRSEDRRQLPHTPLGYTGDNAR